MNYNTRLTDSGSFSFFFLYLPLSSQVTTLRFIQLVSLMTLYSRLWALCYSHSCLEEEDLVLAYHSTARVFLCISLLFHLYHMILLCDIIFYTLKRANRMVCDLEKNAGRQCVNLTKKIMLNIKKLKSDSMWPSGFDNL